MKNFLFPFGIVNGNYSNRFEYGNLTKEEKHYLDFMDSCLLSENERISNACFNTMSLVMKIRENPDLYQPEEIHFELEKIKSTLDEQDRGIISDFMIACINCINIYNGEKVQGKQLKKERKFKK